jgi:pyruvate,water dikinase
MTGTHWIVEGKVDQRWPINTRGNIGEVFPEVLTPLTYHLGVVPAEAGWREAYTLMGVMAKDDFASDEPVIIGCYGGYGYLNLSYLRILGVRAPGSSPQAIDTSFFGEGNPPPYVARPGDKRLSATIKILRTVLKALGQKDTPEVVPDSRRLADDAVRRQPALDADDATLLRFLHGSTASIRQLFRNHMITTGTSAIVAGLLADGAAAAGQPGLVTDLLGAVDGVASAQYSQDLWQVAKIARATPAVMAAFDEGVAGIAARLSGVPAAEEFNESFASFVARHGHRGPNDWEISSRTWENTPELAYLAIDTMRRSEGDLSPKQRVVDTDQRRAEAVEKVRPHVKRMDRMNFDKALRSAPHWARAREATRDLTMKGHNTTRRVFYELARRGAERGGTPQLADVAMLHPVEELPAYVADPAQWLDTIAERAVLRDRFAAVTPPFFITSQAEVPDIEQLEAEHQPARIATAAAGAVLTGAPGSQGVARGRARIVLDPADTNGLEPGDVLVAPLTDPAWTPLFLPAAAVVVNVGALMSHAVIVARELGIPCVVAVDGATTQIPDGATVEVDGVAGTVRVLATPQ